jgi:hypothetical protein
MFGWTTERHAEPVRRGEEAVAAAFVAALAANHASGVEQVVVSPGTTHFTVWTIMDDPDEVMRNRVYDAEMDFYRRYPHLCVHFQLYARLGRPLEQGSSFGSDYYQQDLRGNRAGSLDASTTGSAQPYVSRPIA